MILHYLSLLEDNHVLVKDYKMSYYKKDIIINLSEFLSYLPKKLDKIYVLLKNSYELIIAIFAANYIGADVCVLNYNYTKEEINKIIEELGEGFFITDKDKSELIKQSEKITIEYGNFFNKKLGYSIIDLNKKDSNLIIMTTGTTGSPKAVMYNWDRLVNQVKKNTDKNLSWLLVYPLNHFAGIQVLLYSLVNQGTINIPRSNSFLDLYDSINNGVNAISATPTFWRMLIGYFKKMDITNLNIRRITLGGEIVHQDLIDNIKKVFPNSSIVHVYATTELGSCFSVKDEKEGFPISYLQRKVGNVELKIIDGELYLKTDKHMLKYLNSNIKLSIVNDWIATGDLVEVRGDRVYFLGRKNEVINVGGIKVFPAKVEKEILEVDGVKNVRVHAKKNPIMGNVVCADLEIEENIDMNKVINDIKNKCAHKLNKYEQPVVLRVVGRIDRLNEKIIRRS